MALFPEIDLEFGQDMVNCIDSNVLNCIHVAP